MNLETHNDCDISTAGTSLRGFIAVNYGDIVAAFGEPLESCDDKCDAEWHIRFEDGLIATIYNYKDGKSWNRYSGRHPDQIKSWHLGGFNREAAMRVADLLQIFGDDRLLFDEHKVQVNHG